MAEPDDPGAPLPRLLWSYAPAERREWHRLCWGLDQRLAAVVRRGGEPTILAIRLAWWDEVLAEGEMQKGRGEPLVERWRAIAPAGAAAMAGKLIDGWRMLASPEPLDDDDLLVHARLRGRGLFGLLATGSGTGQDEAVDHAGTIWALWDLAGHVRDEALARQAIDVAGKCALPEVGKLAGRDLKPLRLALAVALADIRARRIPHGGFSLRHYGRLLLAALGG